MAAMMAGASVGASRVVNVAAGAGAATRLHAPDSLVSPLNSAGLGTLSLSGVLPALPPGLSIPQGGPFAVPRSGPAAAPDPVKAAPVRTVVPAFSASVQPAIVARKNAKAAAPLAATVTRLQKLGRGLKDTDRTGRFERLRVFWHAIARRSALAAEPVSGHMPGRLFPSSARLEKPVIGDRSVPGSVGPSIPSPGRALSSSRSGLSRLAHAARSSLKRVLKSSWHRRLVGISLILALLVGCATVPYSGRKQLNLFPVSQEIQMGETAWRDILSKVQISKDARANEIVRRAGMRIADAADRPNYDWEFVVVQDDSTVNAFALPGGKIAVYTGMLKMVDYDERMIAVVIGHEVAHALARHGGERVSQGLLVQLGLTVADIVAKEKIDDEATRRAVLAGLGAGAVLGVILPYSRAHELEADRIGLILMAKAGYDPRVAPDFWREMARRHPSRMPKWLSTHPPSEERVRALEKWMPEAMRYYRGELVALPPMGVDDSPALARLYLSD